MLRLQPFRRGVLVITFAGAFSACEQAATDPLSLENSEVARFAQSLDCDTLWNIWNSPSGCGYDTSDLQDMYELAWDYEHDMYVSESVTANIDTGFRYYVDGRWAAFPPGWVSPSGQNAGFYVDSEGSGPEIQQREDGLLEGPWLTALTAGACVAATWNAANAFDSMVDAFDDYMADPNQTTAQHLANHAQMSLSSAMLAAVGCGAALLSLGSPI